MLSKRYLPSQIQNLTYEENLVKHYKKLEEIQKEDRKKKNVDKEVAGKVKFTESREKTIKFHISEKTNAIEKDNELLLGRLVEISRKKPAALSQVKSENSLPRTLNGPSRRREKSRIAAENEAFARRLLSQQPSFNPKKLEVDYEKHNQRIKNMAKISYFSPRKVRLPPIKYADFDNTKDNKKSVKNAKKEKKNVETDENNHREESPAKVDENETENVKTVPAVPERQTPKTEDVKVVEKQDDKVEKQDVPAQENVAVDDSNKPEEDNKKPASSVAVDNNNDDGSKTKNDDNKSQVLQNDQEPKTSNDDQPNVENKEDSNNTKVDAKEDGDKPVDDQKPQEEEIQDEINNENE